MEQCHHKEPIGKAGFLGDINKKIQSDKESSENNGTYKSFFGVDWQVPVLDGVHSREDHENDTPCQRGFLSRDREGTLCTWPWTAHPFIAARLALSKVRMTPSFNSFILNASQSAWKQTKALHAKGL
ncbi:hypothetical protein IV203_037153 [Nitzschia inconspicua]|uniref:Uncharacterized protein n=1 Tax=Nitzschia inconspicua TaxID=303405 RepID=A0A9K3LNE2_9STRA|nr:hypothetical protein IV203_037153 [Nitzschia inconspicua]